MATSPFVARVPAVPFATGAGPRDEAPRGRLVRLTPAPGDVELPISVTINGRRPIWGGMDRASLEATLARAEMRAIAGERHVSKQKSLIAEVSALGHDIQSYRDFLSVIEQTQRLNIEHVRWLKRELCEAVAERDAHQLAGHERGGEASPGAT